MRVKISNTTDEIEIGQYRPMDKGSLKAFFSLVIYPRGQKILDCRYFVQGDKRWFNFPQKEIKKDDGSKSDYIPLVSYLNKEYLEQLKIAVLTALKDITSEGNNAKKEYQNNKKQTYPLPTEPPDDEGMPF